MINEYVTKRFDAWIKWKFGQKEELCKFFLKHPRRNMVLEKICEQARIYELGAGRTRSDAEGLVKIIDTATGMFCRAALRHQEENLMSESERQRIMSQVDKHDEEILDGIKELETKVISHGEQTTEKTGQTRLKI